MIVVHGNGSALTDAALFAGSGSAVAPTVDALRSALTTTRTRLALLFEATPAALAVNVVDSGVFEMVNQALCDLVGYSREELIGRSAASFMHPEDAARADAHGAEAAANPGKRVTSRIRLIHRAGHIVVADVTLTRLDDASTPLMLAQMVDVSRYMAEAEELRVRSETDALTGLANRVHLTRVLAEMGAAGARCAVLFIDLDGFKPVNDTRGHAAGDEVLARVAEPLLAAAGPSDLVARVGGDEFVIVCRASGAASPSDDWPRRTALHVADRLERALAAPLPVPSGPVQLTASIGISDGTIGAPHPLDMLEQADAAMYAAKERGKNRHILYDAYMRAAAHARHDAMDQVSTALDDGRARVEYQAVVRLGDGQTAGFHAALRVDTADGASVDDDAVTSTLRRIGLVHPVAQWMFREVAGAAAQHLGACRRFVSITIAGRHTSRADLHSRVTDLLAEAGLPPAQLMLGLPEAALTGIGGGSLHELEALCRDGVRIAIDDFGAGATSLSVVENLPISDIRLSPRLVAGADAPRTAATLRAIVGFANDCDITCTATGVDTDDELAAARASGVRLAQGLALAAPRDLPTSR